MKNYAVIDLEMCSVPRGYKRELYNYDYEVIQIGAVLIDSSWNIVDEFMTYVAPEFGTIDSRIEGLTGISRNDVQDAPRFKEALAIFLEWLPENAVLVSWSDNDRKQIEKECEEKELCVDGLNTYLERWIDCQKTFGDKMGAQKNYKLSEALIIADVHCTCGEHDALVDAKNTAQLFIKTETESEMILNQNYCQQPERLVCNPFAALLID